MADSVDELFPQPEITEEVAEAPEQVVEETPVEQEAPSEAEPVVEPEPEPEAPKEQHVPLGKFLDQRDELREYKRRVAELEARQKPQEQNVPDAFDDPAGFAAYQEQRVEQRLTQERFAMSDTIARQQHGAETVEAAVQWAQERAQADPMFAGSYMRQPHPIDWIVQQHKRDADLSDYQKDPVAFARRILEANGQLSAPVAAPVAAAPTPAPAPARVPRSLASQGTAPSDVRETASGPLAGVGALFP